MYPDQIKHYSTEKQFQDHKKMIVEIKEYFESNLDVSNPTLENLRKEEKKLARYYQKWLKKQSR